jgi:hypothetical protein
MGVDLAEMARTDYVRILVVAVAGLLGVGAIEALTLLGAQEWIKFAVLVVTFAVIVLGAYWFVFAQGDRRDGQGR